ncbi:putative fatty acid synthase subunit protein [Eutypa lata UCREL1]|uniref:Putative fatty acid synthase subunit protein n=1 Tax=Eutypa lata (strain UCR-EL1) TaxID=1287681 RepID=M7TTX5_EUTLA|nr:putative fatty acid synthase subunit protein [Eutypa lata UCREL1]
MVDASIFPARQRLDRIGGSHSQGIVVAAALARSDCNSWEDFVRTATWAVELLFWIGWESHAAAPQAPLSPSAIHDSIQRGHGVPSHMLSVRGLELSQLDRAVAACNQHLNIDSSQQHLHVALINGLGSYVVAGTPRSLCGLALRLVANGQPTGKDQSRVPFSQRKPTVACQFLPISAPFHTPHLSAPAQRAKDRFATAEYISKTGFLTVDDLGVPLFHTETGRDVRDAYKGSTPLAEVLIDAVTTKKVDWPKSLWMARIKQDREYQRPSVSHMVVLGDGRLSTLIHQNVDGLGIRVIDGTSLQPQGGVDDNSMAIGSRSELFNRALEPSQLQPQAWKDKFIPRAYKHFRASNSDIANLSALGEPTEDSTAHYTYAVETRLNRVLNAPPVIVAGMTPTTVHPDFVSAIIKAGYHVELAGGGYFNATDMTAAIDKLATGIPPGRGITVNLIYASPVAMGWQIPLLQSLIRRGVPIEGLTIGAGVPSPEVVTGYIQNLGAKAGGGSGGLRHISFKPGTAASIREVIAIARNHPTFPVILQWTGGRGGGHHSTEDFHEPLLETYGEIRRCENLYLVVGSGFGDGAGMLPYFTGEWSLNFGRPAMPVDGILMGSRMMIARESHTSPQSKAVVLKASGVEDSEWETSYGAGGSVLTVVSEMGQPIHKLATRGVRLWRELDDTIFSLPRSERKSALQKRKHEIIRRLNADSHRPWFGRDSTGKSVDLEDMTYCEVLSRLAQLLYVNHQQRWIDPSYQELFQEFAVRVLERLSFSSHLPSAVSSKADSTPSGFLNLQFNIDSPHSLVAKVIAACPDAATQILHPEDARVFVHLCRARGRKPANFILDLDEDFEHWFKKDSLWQSEDVDAVIDQDADRVCILQSPVSLRYSTRDDQSAWEILDDVQRELGSLIEVQRAALRDEMKPPSAISSPASSWVEEVLRPTEDDLNSETWLSLLNDHISSPALAALVSETTVVRAKSSTQTQVQPNCFRQIFAPRRGFSVHVHLSQDELLLVLDGDRHSKTSILVHKSLQQQQKQPLPVFISSKIYETLHTAVSQAFGSASAMPRFHKGSPIPIEAAVVSAWDALIQPLVSPELQGDLLRLVHRSISVHLEHGEAPLSVGEALTCQSRVREITIEPSGKSIIVEVDISRECGRKAVVISSEFFIRGHFEDWHNTFRSQDKEFEVQVNSEVDEAVLRDRKWLRLDPIAVPASTSLVGMTLVFRLGTHVLFKDKSSFSSIKTQGVVAQKTWNGAMKTIGSMFFETDQNQNCSGGDPVVDFLERKGKEVRVDDGGFTKVPLQSPGWNGKGERIVTAPQQNQSRLYAVVSGDLNPIHTSPVFAALAEIPGNTTIVHGMYTVAVCRQVVEDLCGLSTTPEQRGRLRRFSASLVGMVRPGDKLSVVVVHEAMLGGRMVLQVTARQIATGEVVLQGEAEVEQPETAYIFTGQGSQSQGMGMALYESSPVAKALWDEMDGVLMDQFGWSIMNIVKNNPTELTVYFGGPQGQKVLRNYLAMTAEVPVPGPDGTASSSTRTELRPLIPDLTLESESYTFRDPRGLVHATQFAQPAIMLLEKATVEDLNANGLLQQGATFAGHSLGEWGAISSMSGFVKFSNMMAIGFYRGLLMHFAVPRDSHGRTGHTMVAVNPKRVGQGFDDAALRIVVAHIAHASGQLMEIVNFNVEAEQYVCAGHVRNIDLLTKTLDAMHSRATTVDDMREFLGAPSDMARGLTRLGQRIAALINTNKTLPFDYELHRGKATIPLTAIDIPFHSNMLRPGIAAFRRLLEARIHVEDFRPELTVGKWVTNVIGKGFSLDIEYFQKALESIKFG